MKANELDKRILNLLRNRGYETQEAINEFLNPTKDMLNNPFLLNGMKEAKARIEEAIEKNQKIVVYGDYDCDGISACVILYKYFLSRNVLVDVYIPDRFDDGYGLSFDMIDEVIEKSKPNLIITVDLGVTATKEVEKVKKAGVDIIITDHHEPLQELPNCIVIDPKIENQQYPFNGLCGAGVALKLVEALSSREEALKYLDVCAVATIGDIVPLTNENRFIAKAGIEKINSGDCLESYKYMLKNLSLSRITGSDVTFKLVPRINASGRISKGIKVFNFLVEEDSKKREKLYQDIVKDNEERLLYISEGSAFIDEQLKKINLSKDNILMVVGDFHQGVLGILASRVCHDYNRPTIVFTKTEEGTLKGSGRSIDGVDLHLALSNCSNLLVRFGGHKMAVGVEVLEENFSKLNEQLSKEISKQISFKNFITHEKYDIKITEKDINKDFIYQLNSLEPFGCNNEKPTLMLEATALKVTQMKDASFKHFKISTKSGKQIVAFSAEKHVEALRSQVKKHLIVELENNEFKGKVYPQAVLKNVYIKEIKLEEDKQRECVLSLISKYQSEESKQQGKVNEYLIYELDKLLNSLSQACFGTVVVVDGKSEADRLKNIYPKLKNFTLSHLPLANGQNTILINSRFVVDKDELVGYNNIVFTRTLFSHEKDIYLSSYNVYVPKNRAKLTVNLEKDRAVNVSVYNLLKKYNGAIRANNVFEWLEKIRACEGALSISQIMFSCLAFKELGFVKISFYPVFMFEVNQNPPKRELSSSTFMNKLAIRR